MPPRRSKRTSSQAAEAEQADDATMNGTTNGSLSEGQAPTKRARRGSKAKASVSKSPADVSQKRESAAARRRTSSQKQESDGDEAMDGDRLGSLDDAIADSPQKKRPAPKRGAAKKAARGKKTRTPLFEIVSATKSEPSAIAIAVDDWLRAFEQDNVTAMLELVNFLIQAAGCDDKKITKKQYESEDAQTLLRTVTTVKYLETGEGLYPYSKPGQAGRQFRSHFNDLWTKIVTKVPAGSFTNRIWTAAALQMVTAFCKVATRVKNETASVERQLKNEKRHAAKGARARALEKQLDVLDARLTTLTSHMTDFLVKQVFNHRYRDTAPEIRVLCIEMLGSWISTFREMYLDNVYLKYFFWALFDTDVSVRAASIRILESLFKEAVEESRDAEFSGKGKSPRSSQSSQSQLASGAGLMGRLDGVPSFLEKVKPRVVGMTRDSDQDVQLTAIRAATHLALLQKLDQNDLPNLYQLMTADSSAVREEAAGFASEFLFNSIVPANVQEGELAHASLRTLLEMIESSSLTPDFPNWAVDCLWERLSYLQDWSAMTDLLFADDTSSTDPSQHELEQPQQVLLARLVVACANRATGRSIVPGGAQTSGEEASSSQDTITKHFIRHLPSLLERFAGDADVLEQLYALPQVFALSLLSSQRQRSSLNSLLAALASSFEKFGNSDILECIAATFFALRSGLDGTSSQAVDTALTKMFDAVVEDIFSARAKLATPSSKKARGRKSTGQDDSAGQNLSLALLRLCSLIESVSPELASHELSTVITETMQAVRDAPNDEVSAACRSLLLKCSVRFCIHELAGGPATAALGVHSQWLFAELEDALEFARKTELSTEQDADGVPQSCRFGGLGDEAFEECINALTLFSAKSPVDKARHFASATLCEMLVSHFEERCEQISEYTSLDEENSALILACDDTAHRLVALISQAMLYNTVPRTFAPRIVVRYLSHDKKFEGAIKEFLRTLRDAAPREFWKVIVGTLELSFSRWLDEEEGSALKDFQKLAGRLSVSFGVGKTTLVLAPILFQVISEGVLSTVAGVALHKTGRENRWVFLTEGLARFVSKIPNQNKGVGANKLLKFCESQPEQAGIDMLGSDAKSCRREDAKWYEFLGGLAKIAASQGASLDDPTRYANLAKELSAPIPKSRAPARAKAKAPAKSTRPTRRQSARAAQNRVLDAEMELTSGDEESAKETSEGPSLDDSVDDSADDTPPARTGRRASRRDADTPMADPESEDDSADEPDARPSRLRSTRARR